MVFLLWRSEIDLKFVLKIRLPETNGIYQYGFESPTLSKGVTEEMINCISIIIIEIWTELIDFFTDGNFRLVISIDMCF